MADETTPAPLSDAEIAAIQKRLNNLWQARDDMKRLLATLAARDARLAALERERAALREIVYEIAHNGGLIAVFKDETGAVDCPWCETDGRDNPEHDPTCLVTRARALLASTPAPGKEGI